MNYEIPNHLKRHLTIIKERNALVIYLTRNHSKEALDEAIRVFEAEMDGNHFEVVLASQCETNGSDDIIFYEPKTQMGCFMPYGGKTHWGAEYDRDEILNLLNRISFVDYDAITSQYTIVPDRFDLLNLVFKSDIELKIDHAVREIRIYDAPDWLKLQLDMLK